MLKSMNCFLFSFLRFLIAVVIINIFYFFQISKIQEEHEMALKNTKDDFEKAFSLRDEEFSKTKEGIISINFN